MAFFLVELKWHSSSQAALLNYSAFFNAGFKQLNKSAFKALIFFFFFNNFPIPVKPQILLQQQEAGIQNRNT